RISQSLARDRFGGGTGDVPPGGAHWGRAAGCHTSAGGGGMSGLAGGGAGEGQTGGVSTGAGGGPGQGVPPGGGGGAPPGGVIWSVVASPFEPAEARSITSGSWNKGEREGSPGRSRTYAGPTAGGVSGPRPT